jgi:hypothetical protein
MPGTELTAEITNPGNDWLFIETQSRIDHIKAKKSWYITFYRTFRVVVFSLGLLITIFTSWEGSKMKDETLKNTVMMLGIGTSMLVALESIFKFRDKSHGYDIFLQDLRKLRREMNYAVSCGVYDKKKDEFFAKLQEIMEKQKEIISDSYAGTE